MSATNPGQLRLLRERLTRYFKPRPLWHGRGTHNFEAEMRFQPGTEFVFAAEIIGNFFNYPMIAAVPQHLSNFLPLSHLKAGVAFTVSRSHVADLKVEIEWASDLNGEDLSLLYNILEDLFTARTIVLQNQKHFVWRTSLKDEEEIDIHLPERTPIRFKLIRKARGFSIENWEDSQVHEKIAVVHHVVRMFEHIQKEPDALKALYLGLAATLHPVGRGRDGNHG